MRFGPWKADMAGGRLVDALVRSEELALALLEGILAAGARVV